MMKQILLFMAIIVGVGCAESNRSTIGSCELHADTIAVSKKIGADYVNLVRRSMGRNRDALHQLFLLSCSAGFDAASMEGYCDDLGSVLRFIGDEEFGNALAKESQEIRQRVQMCIRYDIGEDTSLELASDLYPVTSDGVPSRIEGQAVTVDQGSNCP
jgi:hypothetical protein